MQNAYSVPSASSYPAQYGYPQAVSYPVMSSGGNMYMPLPDNSEQMQQEVVQEPVREEQSVFPETRKTPKEASYFDPRYFYDPV